MKHFVFTEEHLEDLILVLGVEKGLNEFFYIINTEIGMYMASRIERFSESDRKKILKIFGYSD